MLLCKNTQAASFTLKRTRDCQVVIVSTPGPTFEEVFDEPAGLPPAGLPPAELPPPVLPFVIKRRRLTGKQPRPAEFH